MRTILCAFFLSVILTGCIDVPGTITTVRYLEPGDSGDVWLLRSDVAKNLTNDSDVHENVSFGPDGKIYFSRQIKGDDTTSEIWKMNPDCTGQERLTFNNSVDFHPTVSPDGQKVVWWSNVSGTAHLWIMDVDGSNKIELIDDSSISTFDPEFSPDGKMIAFNRSPDGGVHADIWIGELNENRAEFIDMWSVTNRGYVAAEVDPSWAPSGQSLVYSSYDGPGSWFIEGIDPFLEPVEKRLLWRIYLIDLDLEGRVGKNRRVLLEARVEPYGVSWLPCFSADGGQVAFIRSYLDPAQWQGPYPFSTTSSLLRVINVNGTEDRPISNTGGCYFFDWVP